MNLITISQKEAEQMNVSEGDALISIATPDTKTQKFPAPNLSNWGDLPICQISFHDAQPINGSAEGAILMTTKDAEAIIRFVRENQDCERLVIHCMAGRSRSNSVARFIHERWKDIGLKEQPHLLICEAEEDKNKWVWHQLCRAMATLYFQENFFTKPKESNGNE